jgi:transcriptional regulator with XRE-family HTH domain
MDIIFSERLLEERKRLGLSQEVMAAFGSVQKRAQIYYEQGERMPDARYLAGISSAGVDVLYLVTGKRTPSERNALNKEEQALIAAWQAADEQGKNALLAMLAAINKPPTPAAKQKAGKQSIQIAGTVHTGATLNTGTISHHAARKSSTAKKR